MKVAGYLFALAVLSAPLAAQSAPRLTVDLPAAEQSALEALRKDIWVQWYTGDTASLRRVLAPELIAMSTGGPGSRTLEQAIKGSADFKAKGGKFISVDFDSKMTHHFGGTVVMFSHYTVVSEMNGKRATEKGRATEVFVRAKNGQWVHTSWQLESES